MNLQNSKEMEAFAANFHSLTGTTIGERRKNLFKLLRTTTQLPQHSDLDLSSLRPKSVLEEKFKVETLIHFGRTHDLVKILRSENPTLIGMTLKKNSILLKAFNETVNGEDFVRNVLARVSFNVKIKLLHRLARVLSRTRADDYFKAIQERYGLYLASKLLPACSEDVILETLGKKIRLTQRQLVLAIEKCPETAEKLLEKYKANHGWECGRIFAYLAQNDVRLFLKLHKRFGSDVKLGRRSTGKFVATNREEVIEKATDYINVLHLNQVVKSLRGDFERFYSNLFPATLEEFTSNYFQYHYANILVMKLTGNHEMLLKTFQKNYQSDYFEHSQLMEEDVLEMIPPSVRCAKMKIQRKSEHMSEEMWYCYLNTDQSLPFLKKTISLSSDIIKRTMLAGLLVRTCKVNKDLVALEDVCKYVVNKHRNDNIAVRQNFLKHLQASFPLRELSQQHWDAINELLSIFSLNEEEFDDSSIFLEEYIRFRFRQHVPGLELKRWLQEGHARLNLIRDDPELEKRCLILFGEFIPELFENKKDSMLPWLRFLEGVVIWNQHHRLDLISLFSNEDALRALKRSLIEDDDYEAYKIDTILFYCLRHESEREETKDLSGLYFKKRANFTIASWMLRHKPFELMEHLFSATAILLTRNCDDGLFWQHCKYYSHLGIPQKIVKMALEMINDHHSAIAALSHLTAHVDFKNIILPLYPAGLRAESEEDKRLYALRKTALLSLKNSRPSSDVLDTVLPFCKGDYLKLSLCSLYSHLQNANENKIASVVEKLYGLAVSVRKHALPITFRFMSKEDVYDRVDRFMATEKNNSVIKVVVKNVFNFFLVNSVDRVWELLKASVRAADEKDREALDIFLHANRIPKEYLIRYVVFVWEFLEKTSAYNKHTVLQHKFNALSVLDPKEFQLLPTPFCRNIIEGYLLRVCDFFYYDQVVGDFTCQYLIHCENRAEQSERLQILFGVLENRSSTVWKIPAKKIHSRQQFGHFLTTFCEVLLSHQDRHRDVFDQLARFWKGMLKPYENFEDHLRLEFTALTLENLCAPQVCRKLIALCNSHIQTYGNCIVDRWGKVLKEFAKHLIKRSDDDELKTRYELLETMLEIDDSANCVILAMTLIDRFDKHNRDISDRHEKIIATLERHADVVVRLRFDELLH